VTAKLMKTPTKDMHALDDPHPGPRMGEARSKGIT
jgi:hypothetical protein